MRGTYEAFILVRIKDGRQYVCALNRRKSDKPTAKMSWHQQQDYLRTQVIWN